MANFATKKTGTNMTSFEYYIVGKDDWKVFQKLKIENTTKTLAALVDKNGDVIKTFKNGDEVELLDNKSYTIHDKVHAKIKSGTKSGFIQINKLGKPKTVDVLSAEKAAIDSLDKLIKSMGATKTKGICIVVRDHRGKITPDYTFKSVLGARNVSGTPKADFIMFNTQMNAVAFISHKKAGGARAFQQFSGISQQAGRTISDHPTVKKALREFEKVKDKIVKKKQRFKYLIPKDAQGKKLVNLSVYGPDFGKAFGNDNVHFIGQGDPILKELPAKDKPAHLKGCGLVFELTFSDGMELNGEVDKFFKNDDFRAALGARFNTGRSFDIDGKKVQNIRVLLAPQVLFGSKAEEIK